MKMPLLRQKPLGFRFVLIYALALMYGWTLWACGDDPAPAKPTAAAASTPTYTVVDESSQYQLVSQMRSGSIDDPTYAIKINDSDVGTFTCPLGNLNCSKTGVGDLEGVTTASSTSTPGSQTVVIPLNTILYDKLAAKGTTPSSMTITAGGGLKPTTTKFNIKDGRTNIAITNPLATAVIGSAFSAEYTHAPLKSAAKKVTWTLLNKSTVTTTTVETTCSNASIPSNTTCTTDETTSGTVTVAASALPTAGEYTLQGTLKDSAGTTLNSSSATITVAAAPLARLVPGTTTGRLEVGKPFALNAKGSTFGAAYKVEYLVEKATAECKVTDTDKDVPSVTCSANPGTAATVSLKITFGGQTSISTVAIGQLLALTGAGS